MTDRRIAGDTGAFEPDSAAEGGGGSAHSIHWVEGNREQCCKCGAVFPTVQAAMESVCPQPNRRAPDGRHAGWVAGVRDAALVLSWRGLVTDEVLAVLEDLQREGTICARCGELLVHHDPTGDGLSDFWSHARHPRDGHDAVPLKAPAETPCDKPPHCWHGTGHPDVTDPVCCRCDGAPCRPAPPSEASLRLFAYYQLGSQT